MTDRKRIKVRDLDFAYLEQGEGPLVLCLHGFPDHALTYEPLLSDLATAGFRGIAPWLRGYAPTAVPDDGQYHTAALALDAIALADALAPDQDAYLIGHDWGAGATYLAAGHRPDRFKKIVAMAVPPAPVLGGSIIGNPDQLKRSWYMWFFQMPFAELAVQQGDYAFIDKLWADWSPGYTPPAEFMRALKDTFASPGCLEAAIGYYRATIGRQEQPADLAEVSKAGSKPTPVPCLYLHGTDDGCLGADLIDPDQVRAAFGAGGDVALVEGTGHFLHLEKPDEVNSKVVEFLRA